MNILITAKKIAPSTLSALCQAWFGNMVKIEVDIERKVIAVGGALHADGEFLLIENGSRQEDIWGANFYPYNAPEDRIEFTALINIRPHQENPSMEIVSKDIRVKVKRIAEQLLLGPDEKLV